VCGRCRVAFALVALLALGSASGAWREAGSGTAATEGLVRVNGHLITRRELQTYFATIHADERTLAELEALPPVEREQLYGRELARVLPELIKHRLLLEAALGEYGDAEAISAAVGEALQERLQQLARERGSMLEVIRALHRRGVSLQDWKRLMTEAVIVENYLRRRTRKAARVSPRDMRRYYRLHKHELRRPRKVVYRIILVDPAGCETPEQEKARAEELRERILRGEDFAQLAERYSLERDVTDGGLHEVQAPANAPDWLPPVCEGLKPGEPPQVRKTGAGYVVVRLEEVIPARVPGFAEAQDEVRAALQERRRREVEDRLLAELRAGAHIEWLPAGLALTGQ